MGHINAPTLIAFGAYLLVMIFIGLWVYRRTNDYEDFALGGRKLPGPVAALSAQASDMSGWLLLGLPGAVYATGIGASWIAIGLAIGAYLNWLIVARRLRTYTERANNAVSLSAYFDSRFEDPSRLLRIVSAAVIVVFFTVYVSSGLVAGGVLFEQVFEVDGVLAITIALIVIVAYTFLGGFLAVSLTDVVQGLMMFFALLILPVVGLSLLGGFGGLNAVTSAKSPDLLNFNALLEYEGGVWSTVGPLGAVTIISGLAWGLGYFGQPHIIARFMGIRSTKDIPAARRIAASWTVLVLLGACLTAIIGVGLLDQPLENPETVFIALIQQLMNPWVAGLFLAAVLAAIMSTADSQLLVASTALTEDFYRAFFRKEASERILVWVGRLTVVVVAIVAFGLSLIALNSPDPEDSSVLAIVAYAWAGFGASFGPVILLSLFWSRMTWTGALAGIVGGAVTTLLWPTLDATLGTGLYEIVPGFVVALVVIVVFNPLGTVPRRAWHGVHGGDGDELTDQPVK